MTGHFTSYKIRPNHELATPTGGRLAARQWTGYVHPVVRSIVMLGLISYGLFLAVLVGLMRIASIRDKRDRANAVAAMLSARVI